MKRSIIAAAVVTGLFMSSGAFAAGVEEGTLTITGMVSGTACKFLDTANTATITLDDIPATVLTPLAAGQDTGYGENEADKNLILECNSSDNVKIKVDGSAFDYNSVIENTGTGPAEVGFKLFHKNVLITKDGQDEFKLSDLERLGLSTEGNTQYGLRLSARYAKALGAAGAPVGTGEVKANIKLIVVQD
ncbi:fimbrial protein [Citrobacter sp. wls708]|uniref:fimbrial protein n=1 Tax=Citrobacter sp. wls708 TaxID=2576427 RepID=UPI0014857EFE|nr:fimbrial protein [Citrobacter sp. wls708]